MEEYRKWWKMVRAFIITIFILSLSSCAHNAEDDQFKIGKPTTPPLGWSSFCILHPEECKYKE